MDVEYPYTVDEKDSGVQEGTLVLAPPNGSGASALKRPEPNGLPTKEV